MKSNELLFGFTRKFLLSVALVFLGLWFFAMTVGNVVFLPFGFSVITAYIFHSLVDKISTKFSISRSIIAFLIVLLIFTTLVVFAIVFIPIAARNALLIKQYLPNILNAIDGIMVKYIPTQLHQNIIASYSRMESLIPQVMEKVLSKSSNISSFFTQVAGFFLITPITTYYMIKDWHKINDNILDLIPQQYRDNFINIRTEIRDRLAGYLAGQFSIILFLSIFYGLALWLVDLEFGFTIGVLTGLASIIPYVGITTGITVAILVAFLQGKSIIFIGVIGVVFTCGQAIEGSFLTPKLMSSKIHIHPLWVIFGFLTFSMMFGFIGVLFALPLTAIASVLIKFYVKNLYKKYYS